MEKLSISERLNNLNVDYQLKSEELIKEIIFMQKYSVVKGDKNSNE